MPARDWNEPTRCWENGPAWLLRWTLPIPTHPIALDFDHLKFAYTGEDWILKDLHFQLPAGQSLGVLGRTGSGKTTLARLLFRLYDPQSGEIRFNGTPIKVYSLKAIPKLDWHGYAGGPTLSGQHSG